VVRLQFHLSKEPLKLIFLAGFAYALAAGEVFAAHLSDATSWSYEWVVMLVAVGLGWFLTCRAVWLSIKLRTQAFLVCSLAVYWLLALVGLLIMALAEDPMPFLSTLVSALISVMVAWLVGNILKERRQRSQRGWWRARRL
jgi:CHASE2 domain-containing sensor protein